MRSILILVLFAAAGGNPSAVAQSVFRNGFEPDGVPEGLPLNDTGWFLFFQGAGTPGVVSFAGGLQVRLVRGGE
ncbi:MAG: hypothetical protein ACT4NL_10650 [Pseudomarimonas sp.]